MSEGYISIFNDDLLAAPYDFERLEDNRKSLRITLRADGGGCVDIVFSSMLAYCWMNEGDALRTLKCILPGSSPDVPYESSSTEFLKWYHQGSFGVREAQSIKSFTLLTLDDVLEVLSFERPEIHLSL